MTMKQVNAKKKDTSLETATRRFVEEISQNPGKKMDVAKVISQGNITQRRVYDIMNALDGIGLIQREGSKNQVTWVAPPLEDLTISKYVENNTIYPEIGDLGRTLKQRSDSINKAENEISVTARDLKTSGYDFIDKLDVKRAVETLVPQDFERADNIILSFSGSNDVEITQEANFSETIITIESKVAPIDVQALSSHALRLIDDIGHLNIDKDKEVQEDAGCLPNDIMSYINDIYQETSINVCTSQQSSL